MHVRRWRATILLTGILATGCAAGGRPPRDAAPGDQNQLTEAQIRAAGARDAYEAVERLRPLWLRSRTQTSVNAPNTILVYLDQTRLGGIEALHGYPIDGITGMRYLSASEAANKLLGTGSTVVEGAIVISTRRQ